MRAPGAPPLDPPLNTTCPLPTLIQKMVGISSRHELVIDLLDSKYRCVLHVPWQNLLSVDFVLLTLSCTQFSNGYYVSDLRQVSGFLRVLRFPPTIKLTATI